MRRGDVYMAHRTGFTRDTLLRALEQAGFSGGGVEEEDGYELRAVAYR